MENSQRLELAEKSKLNRKLEAILEHRETFEAKIADLKNDLTERIKENQEILDGCDISVCVRIRPLLEYEKIYFNVMATGQNQIHLAEPRISVKGQAKIIKSTFQVDHAFGPEQTNDQIYENISDSVISMGLQGGVSTIFAYGQTASGKTFTISGILKRLCQDLVTKKPEHLELFLSIFEILGNDTTDLLSSEKGQKIDILEDKFGQVNIKNVQEEKIETSDQFQNLIKSALAQRQTATTFKNDTSSRSHFICQIRVKNLKFKSIEDGKIFIIDLAGSENASDSQFHDKSRIKETQAINKSLMALKDCIRNRAMSAQTEKYFHVPYRQSKLTLLLKDAFEVESRKLCKTIVIANVAPTCADISMTLNTLRYVSPLKIGALTEKIVKNPDNPANWNNEKLREWCEKYSKGRLNLEEFCPFQSGMQILRLHEAEFIEKAIKSHPSWGEKAAEAFHANLWKLLIDARTKDRKNKLKVKGESLKERLHKQNQAYVHIYEKEKNQDI